MRRSLALLLVLGAASPAAAGIFSAYRWASLPSAGCDVSTGGPNVTLGSQPFEWISLPPAAQILFHYVVNGDDLLSGPFDAPDGSGAQTFAGFGSRGGSLPLTFSFEVETLDGGVLLYRSALTAMCTAVGGDASASRFDWFGNTPPRYYRWRYAPEPTCTSHEGFVQLRFPLQPVEWRDLPEVATVGYVYSKNGAATPDGPFELPDGSGSFDNPPLVTTAGAYPIHYAVRLDTILVAQTLYQSVLVGSCTADGTGTSRVTNVPEPDATALSLAACVALALRAGRRRRA